MSELLNEVDSPFLLERPFSSSSPEMERTRSSLSNDLCFAWCIIVEESPEEKHRNVAECECFFFLFFFFWRVRLFRGQIKRAYDDDDVSRKEQWCRKKTIRL